MVSVWYSTSMPMYYIIFYVFNTVMIRCNHPHYILTNEQFIIIKENSSVYNISFRCNGSMYMMTYMENGEWEPDPREIINHYSCQHNKGSIFSSTAGITLLTPVAPSGTVFSSIMVLLIITVYAVSSIVLHFIGHACGWFGHKRKQSHTISDRAKKNARIEQSHDQLPQTPGPLYEGLQPSTFTPEYQNLVETKRECCLWTNCNLILDHMTISHL